MKLLSRLVIALVICLLAIPIMATPVQAIGITGMTLHPNKGNIGEEVYITGNSNADSHYYVYYQIDTDEWEEVLDYYDIDFDGTDLEGYSYTTEKFEIPESCGGKHKISICNASCDEDDDDDIEDNEEFYKYFTVEPKVEITKPTDAEGPMGTEVEVKGTGFDEEEEGIDILLDGDVVSEEEFTADGYGNWEGTFLVPAASKGDHDVSAEGDYTDEEDVEEASFEVTPGISIDPTSGSPGATVTVTGSGFEEDEEDIDILFDGDTVAENIEADDGYWEGTFEVPQAASGIYDVTAEGETTDKADIDEVEFEVVPSLTLSPTQGHVGTSLTVSGSGLPASESVTVTYDGVEKGTATTDSNGVLSGITFEATHTQSTHTAEHSVVVTYDTTTVTRNFVMESDAPSKPTLTSPASGSRIGLVRKVTSTFAWSAVTDDSSPVSYSLQIGTSADFAQVLISRTGLTQTSYTLTATEALPYGAYYWRVKAMDGAQNDSGWTSAYSFKSGLLPFWAFIVIVAIIVVFVAALFFLLGERRR